MFCCFISSGYGQREMRWEARWDQMRWDEVTMGWTRGLWLVDPVAPPSRVRYIRAAVAPVVCVDKILRRARVRPQPPKRGWWPLYFLSPGILCLLLYFRLSYNVVTHFLFRGHTSLPHVYAMKYVFYTHICFTFALSKYIKLPTILIMATGGLPQSQLSLGSCGVGEKRSSGPLGLDMTQRETEAMRPADPGGASWLYTPSTLDDLSCYDDLQDRPKPATTSMAMKQRKRRSSREPKPSGAQLHNQPATQGQQPSIPRGG